MMDSSGQGLGRAHARAHQALPSEMP